MEIAPDAVPTKFLHHRIACVFGNVLAGVANVAQRCARFHGGDARHHAFVGNVNQALRLRADFAHGKHAAAVAVKTVFFNG